MLPLPRVILLAFAVAAAAAGVASAAALLPALTIAVMPEDGQGEVFTAVENGNTAPDFLADSETLFSMEPLYPNATFTWSTNETETLNYVLRYTFSVSSSWAEVSGVPGSVTFEDVADRGVVPATPTAFSASLVCTDSFTGLVSVTVFAWTAATVFDPVEFFFLWDCARPGCNDVCEEHGSCIELLGECACDGDWIGADCDFQFNMSAEEYCPGDTIAFTYSFARTTCQEWFYIENPNYETLYWLYFLTRTSNKLSPCTPDGAYPEPSSPFSGELSITVQLEPGDYTLWVLRDDDYDTYGGVYFTVRPYEDCGYDESCFANETSGSSDEALLTCSSAGECSDEGFCVCNSSRFWADCSRGCSLFTELNAAAGTVDNDPGAEALGVSPTYIPYTACRWLIEPTGVSFDVIEIAFERFSLGYGDRLVIGEPNSTLGVSSGSANYHTFAGTVMPNDIVIRADRVLVSFQSDYTTSSTGFRFTYNTRKLPLSSGSIAGISVAGGVVLAAMAFLLVVLIIRRRRAIRRAQQAARAEPAEHWTLEEERASLAVRESASQASGDQWDNLGLYGVHITKHSLDFGLEKKAAFPIHKLVKDSVTISNESSKPIQFCFYVPGEEHFFTCNIKPGKGTLKPGFGVSLDIELMLLCTTRVSRKIKLCIWAGSKVKGSDIGALGPFTNPEDPPSATALIDIEVEGEVSERLDPADIALGPQPLGAGAFGAVYPGTYRSRMVAVKVMRRQQELLELIIGDFEKEINLYKRLRNPLVVEFVGASMVPGKLCMCTELIEGGSLEHLIQNEPIGLALQLKFALNVAEAVKFLHENSILYRDLKPSNVLIVSLAVNAKINCKIGDFGTSRNVKDASEFFTYTTGQGTPIYMAPEMLALKPYNCKIDLYSYAITLWQMLTAGKPWESCPVWDVPKRVIDGDRPPIPSAVAAPAAYIELIQACWAPDPEARPPFATVVQRLEPLVQEARKQHREMATKMPHAPRKKKTVAPGQLTSPRTATTGAPTSAPGSSSASAATTGGANAGKPLASDTDGFATTDVYNGRRGLVLAPGTVPTSGSSSKTNTATSGVPQQPQHAPSPPLQRPEEASSPSPPPPPPVQPLTLTEGEAHQRTSSDDSAQPLVQQPLSPPLLPPTEGATSPRTPPALPVESESESDHSQTDTDVSSSSSDGEDEDDEDEQ